MDLNHAGEPDKGVCYGQACEPMTGRPTTTATGPRTWPSRRAGVLLIDSGNDGDTHESARSTSAGSGTPPGCWWPISRARPDKRGRASVCVVRGDRCRIQGESVEQPERRMIPGEEYFAGRWKPGGPARLGARVGRCVDLDDTGDDRPDKHMCYEDLGTSTRCWWGTGTATAATT